MSPNDVKSLPQLLYVDDNREARSLVRRVLAGQYIVLEAGDPLSGIELARDTRPDMVLLDINLPNMTGVDVAIRLRSFLPASTPIVALTSDIHPDMRDRALAAGFTGFLSKPVEIDTFEEELRAFMGGKRELLQNPERHLREYQNEVVERLENRVRELSNTLSRNDYLQKQNQAMIDTLLRRQKLLEAGARVSHSITSILELSNLLPQMVNTIVESFGFYYAGIFLVDEKNEWAYLRAGYGDAGKAMLAEGHKLQVGGNSMIGTCIQHNEARIALDVGEERAHFKNPPLPQTRSEMALPLYFGERVLGAVTVQSVEERAFSQDDITTLQTMADHLAVAVHNAYTLNALKGAHSELLRSKTFEAIATATGEAIHWVGNKAAPVPGSARRVREDLINLLSVFQALTAQADTQHPLFALAQNLFEEAEEKGIHLSAQAQTLAAKPARQLAALVSLESIFEDLQIIENSARTILSIKEDLIGPARQRKTEAFALPPEVTRLVEDMALPKGAVTLTWAKDLPPVLGDSRQVDQIFNNLIKNAWEAMAGRTDAHIWVSAEKDSLPGMVRACVRDNGPGIPPDLQEKIWVSFFTTKGGRGGTGLGLSACMEIAHQHGGKIWLESEPGKGAAFYVTLPCEI